MAAGDNAPLRRHELDVVRVAVFGLLMIYHTSLIFGTRHFFINADEPNRLVNLISLMSHPWRMSILFFLSGVVTASLAARKTPQQIVSIRTRQLVPPLLFGVMMLVPVQEYIMLQSRGGLDISYLDFWRTYLLAGSITDGQGVKWHLIAFDYLWFLAYLWSYTAILMLLRQYAPAAMAWISRAFSLRLQGVGLWLWPVLYLAAMRIALYPVFGETLMLFDDVYVHTVYLAFFLAGAALAESDGFWRRATDNRIRLGLASAGLFCVLAAVTLSVPADQRSATLTVLLRVARSAFQSFSILAILGFARHHIRSAHPVVAYLNKAVMTYYVLHQPIIVLVAYWLQTMGMLQLPSFPVVVLISGLICAVLYEGQRRLFRRRVQNPERYDAPAA